MDGARGTAVGDLIEVAGTLAGPWARFWARMLDFQISGAVVGVSVGFLLPATFLMVLDGLSGQIFWIMLVAPLMMAVEAAQFALFGTTLGKLAVGVRVASIDGGRLTAQQSRRRAWSLYLNGLILGIPIISLLAYAQNYQHLKEGRLTSWDVDAGARVYGERTSPTRTFLVASATVILALAFTAL